MLEITPGPWKVGSPRLICVIDHGQGFHGNDLCRFSNEGWYDGMPFPCEIYQDKQYEPRSREELANYDGCVIGFIQEDIAGVIHEADAYLIAAAPDLLAAARSALARLTVLKVNRGREVGSSQLWITKLDAAIAKAEGRD